MIGSCLVNASSLPALNATLNLLSTLLLVLGYWRIKRGDRRRHQRAMLAALVVSGLFLTSYLIYHSLVGSVPYPHHDWTRPVYFAILIPHASLAALMVPFIFAALWHAWRQHYPQHRRIVRWLWPVWMFVCTSGVIVYLMLYHL